MARAAWFAGRNAFVLRGIQEAALEFGHSRLFHLAGAEIEECAKHQELSGSGRAVLLLLLFLPPVE